MISELKIENSNGEHKFIGKAVIYGENYSMQCDNKKLIEDSFEREVQRSIVNKLYKERVKNGKFFICAFSRYKEFKEKYKKVIPSVFAGNAFNKNGEINFFTNNTDALLLV